MQAITPFIFKHMRNNSQKSSLEEAIIKKDYEKLIRYAKHIIISSCRIPDPDKTGIPREDIINEAANRGIQYAWKDYERGLYRENGDIDGFIRSRVCEKAFHEVYKEFFPARELARFNERFGKYYEGSADHEAAFCDEYDSDSTIETKFSKILLDDSKKQEIEDKKDKNKNKNKKKKNEDEEERIPKEPGGEVERHYYSFSTEKERILEESWNVKMEYVKRIRNLVSKMSPMDQRLFDIRFGFNLSEEDYQKIDEIQKAPHVKEYYNKLAAEEFGISEGAARKRVNDLLGYIKKNLNADGLLETYRANTSIPGLSEFRVANPETDFSDFNLDNLSEYDCLDILMGLKFQ